jgi:hypothetical protein
MDNTSMLRLRWRLHGAWMWPTFIALTVADGLLIHSLPISGDRQSTIGGALLGAFLGLAGIVFVTPLLGLVLRRVRRDMPRVVARDYAGTTVVVAVTAALLGAGLVHHSTISADQHALQDAEARAVAYIGDRAPGQFRSNLGSADTYELQPPLLYRVCVANAADTTHYCVVVDRSKRFSDSVRPAGSTSNQVLSQGTW